MSYLHDDRSTLISRLLVNAAWLNQAMRYILRRILAQYNDVTSSIIKSNFIGFIWEMYLTRIVVDARTHANILMTTWFLFRI